MDLYMCMKLNLKKTFICSWGSHRDGKLGISCDSDILEPEKIHFFDGKPVSKIACGSDHSVVLTGTNIIT